MKALPGLLALLVLAASVGVVPAGGPASAEAPERTAGTVADGPVVDVVDGAAASTNHTDESDSRVRVLAAPAGADTRTSIDSHRANIGPTSGLETETTTAEMQTESIVDHIEAAEESGERQRRLVAAESRVRQAEVSLHERQRNAIEAHAAGELSDEALLVELARVTAEAAVLTDRLAAFEELAEETPGFSLGADELAFRLNVYRGPVRAHALETFRGEAPPRRFYVETVDDAVVMTAVDGSEYVREVYRDDRWDRSADGREDQSEAALERTLEAYPRIEETSPSADTLGTGGVVRVSIPFDGGQLRTFVSGGDGDIFIEHQRRTLDSFSDGEPVTTTQDGLNLTVERTYPGGPVRVSVFDEETDEPVGGATVTVAVDGNDSVEVGKTDADGTLWTLSPHDPYRITVLDDPRVAWVDGLEPTEAPRVEPPRDEDE